MLTVLHNEVISSAFVQALKNNFTSICDNMTSNKILFSCSLSVSGFIALLFYPPNYLLGDKIRK